LTARKAGFRTRETAVFWNSNHERVVGRPRGQRHLDEIRRLPAAPERHGSRPVTSVTPSAIARPAREVPRQLELDDGAVLEPVLRNPDAVCGIRTSRQGDLACDDAPEDSGHYFTVDNKVPPPATTQPGLPGFRGSWPAPSRGFPRFAFPISDFVRAGAFGGRRTKERRA
jgi:hypothetical protein